MLGRNVLRKDSNAYLEFSVSVWSSQRQHSEVIQALHRIMLLNFWVAAEKIPIETNHFWCMFVETPGSTVQ
jgi:hypothetical protein